MNWTPFRLHMPSGRTHRTVTTIMIPPTMMAAGVIAYSYGQSTGIQDGVLAACLAGAGMLATLAVHPDLDLVETYIHLKVRKNPLSFFWYALWWPYGKMVSHRSWISHFPILGTLGRLVYIITPIIIIFSCLLTQMPEYGAIYRGTLPRMLLMWVLFGMFISDTIHYILDTTTTKIKQIT